MGLAFTEEIDRPVAARSLVHSDNVIGNPGSLSDHRLKQNQEVVHLPTLTSIFDAIDTKEYDPISTGTRTEGNPLPSERRVGFIADDIKGVLPAEWTNIVGIKPVNDTDYLTLDYSRMVSILWGVVKSQKQRLEDLEPRISGLEA